MKIPNVNKLTIPMKIMNLTDSQKSEIKSLLTKFENYQEGLGLFLERKHGGNEKLNFDNIFQTLLDQNHQLKILKDVVVKLFEIQDLDPEKKTYLSNYYSP